MKKKITAPLAAAAIAALALTGCSSGGSGGEGLSIDVPEIPMMESSATSKARSTSSPGRDSSNPNGQTSSQKRPDVSSTGRLPARRTRWCS